MRTALFILAASVGFLTMADHALRVDWANECAKGDTIQCPDRLWWFAKGCETDSECLAVAPLGDFM